MEWNGVEIMKILPTLIFIFLTSITFVLPALSQTEGDVWACVRIITGNLGEHRSTLRQDKSPEKLIWTSKTTFRLQHINYENVSVYSKSKKQRVKTNNYIDQNRLGTIYMTDLPNKFGVKLLILNEPQTYGGIFSEMTVRWYECST